VSKKSYCFEVKEEGSRQSAGGGPASLKNRIKNRLEGGKRRGTGTDLLFPQEQNVSVCSSGLPESEFQRK